MIAKTKAEIAEAKVKLKATQLDNEYVGKETKTLPPKFILVHDYYLQ